MTKASTKNRKMLDHSDLRKRDTNAGRDIAGFGTAPIWEVEDVVIVYENWFEKTITDVFRVSLKRVDEGLVLTASATATLQWWVDEEWLDKPDLPDYDGRYDDLPGAGLRSSLGKIRRREQEAKEAADSAGSSEPQKCVYPNCGRQASILADAGPSCYDHYDDLC